MPHEPKNNGIARISLSLCLFRRLFVIGTFGLMMGAIANVIARRDSIAFVLMGLSFPFFGIAVCLVLSTLAFPFEFSSLGQLKRRSAPLEVPVYVWRGSWGVIGQLRAQIGGVTWTLFPSGLGMQIHLVGSAFLAWVDVDRIDRTDPRVIVLHHRAIDLRSPIELPRDLEQRSNWTIPPSGESRSRQY